MKTVAEFEIQYHQFLDAEGRPTGSLPDFVKDPAELLKMYRTVLPAVLLMWTKTSTRRLGCIGSTGIRAAVVRRSL